MAHEEKLRADYAGRLVVYTTETGREESGLALSVDDQGRADLKLFIGGPDEVVKRGVPAQQTVGKPPYWRLAYPRKQER